MTVDTVLEQIISLDGDCLDSVRCSSCPFKGQCLTEFATNTPPSKKTRRQMALDKLTIDALLNETIEWRRKVKD
jgi:propanediol dehydratase small subunit